MNKLLLKDALCYIDSFLDYRFAHLDIPGWTIGILHNGELLYKRAWGYANLEEETPLTTAHTFRIASHSKMFTSISLMQLKEKGRLQLDDKVSKYVSWFKSSKDHRVKEITLRQLLTHTSGFIRDGNDCAYWQTIKKFPSRSEFRAYVANAQNIMDANEYFKYSNFGYTALGLVVEAVSGQAYCKYVKKNIFDKLRLYHSGMELDDSAERTLATGYTRNYHKQGRQPLPHLTTSSMASATGAYSTVSDICHFAASLCFGDNSLITDESKRELFWPYSTIEPRQQRFYGMGFDLQILGGRSLVGHGGGFPGYITKTLVDPKDRLAVVVFTNSLDGDAETIATSVWQIIDLFQKSQDKPKKEISKQNLAQFSGRFYALWGAVDFVPIGKALMIGKPDEWDPFQQSLKAEVLNKTTLQLKKQHGFESVGETIKFTRNKAGEIVRVIYAGTPLYPWEKFKWRSKKVK